MKRFWIAVLICALSAVPVWAAQRIDERHKVNADVTVKIEDVVSGSLTIIGWNKKEVEITGTIGDDVLKLKVDVDADRVSIRPVMPDGNSRGVDVDLTIKIPEKASRVSAGAVSASIDVRGVKRRLEVGTVSGPIDVDGDLEEAEIATVSGEINSRGKRSKLEVASVSGNMPLAGDADDASLAIFSGNIQFTGRPRSLEISSVSGNVRLAVPDDIQADFEISTFSGSITNAFGHKPKKKSFVGGQELEFSTGSKGDIEISLVSGNVKIEKQ